MAGAGGGGGAPPPPPPPTLPPTPPPTGLPAYSAAAAISADVEVLEEAAATAAAAAAAAAADDEVDEDGAFRLAAPLTCGKAAAGAAATAEAAEVTMVAAGSILISEVGMSWGCCASGGGDLLDSGLCSLRRSFQWNGSLGDRSILRHDPHFNTNRDLVTKGDFTDGFSYVYSV